jgi:hypothetical protein
MIGDASPITEQDIITLGWLMAALWVDPSRLSDFECGFVRLISERLDICGNDTHLSIPEREQIAALLDALNLQEEVAA